MIGEYEPLDQKIRCCVRNPSGVLCSELHATGFVARLADNTVTVIGHTCAEKKFGIDSKLTLDRKAHERRKAMARKLGRLSDLLEMRHTIEGEYASAEADAAALGKVLAELKSELGPDIHARLASMARDGRGAVTVTGITINRFRDDDGRQQEEKLHTQHRIGHLAGMDIFRASAISGLHEMVRKGREALSEAVAAADSRKRISPAKVDRLVASLGDFGRVGREARDLRDAHSRFLENDFSLLCFLESQKTTRYKAAHLALRQRGQPDSKDNAKSFVAALDANYKAAFRVDQLQF